MDNGASSLAKTDSTRVGLARIDNNCPRFCVVIATDSLRNLANLIACSTVITPACSAAPHSPKLCPKTKSGRMPPRRIESDNVQLTAKTQSCVNHTSYPRRSWVSPKSSTTPSRPICRSVRSKSSKYAAAKRSCDTTCGIAEYCEPCPGKAHATRPAPSPLSHNTANWRSKTPTRCPRCQALLMTSMPLASDFSESAITPAQKRFVGSIASSFARPNPRPSVAAGA